MNIYYLYRSGILNIIVYQEGNTVTFQQRDVFTNVWSETKTLTKKKDKNIAASHYFYPLDILGKVEEFKSLFSQEKNAIKTSWGAKYEKNENYWVERNKKQPLDVRVDHQCNPIAFVIPSRENTFVFVKKGYEAYTPLQYWRKEGISEAEYAVNHLGTFYAKMRDNISLATEVWIPSSKEQSFPTIFIRTPYGRMQNEGQYFNFVQRGYAVVVQDTRGREDSEGEWIPMYFEVEDGHDSLDWIAQQSWCDGNIGMIGASYGGYVQWAAASSDHPNLKALVSIVTAGSPFIDIPRKGGALVSGMLAWVFAMSEKKFAPENMLRTDWQDVLQKRPIKDIPKLVLGKDISFWNTWMQHIHDDDFWKKSSWMKNYEGIKTPAMVVSGWYDDNGMGTSEALDVIKHFKKEDKKIILGPWLHNGNSTRDIQDVSLGNNSLRYDLDVLYQQWFDKKLKGKNNDLNDMSVVEYYDTGVNEWCVANNWPPEQISYKTFYLNKLDSANILQDYPNELKGSSSYSYNPKNPTPQLLDMSENEVGVPADYQEIEKRTDVLTFTSSAIAQEIKIVGDIEVVLYASSSAKDTDWIVKVTDVDSEGHSIKLVDGVLRARYAQSFESEHLLQKDEIRKYVIRTGKLANTFKKGHRIRLVISSSAENFIFPNQNTGKNPFEDENYEIAHQTIYHSQEHPSHIVVPFLK